MLAINDGHKPYSIEADETMVLPAEATLWQNTTSFATFVVDSDRGYDGAWNGAMVNVYYWFFEFW